MLLDLILQAAYPTSLPPTGTIFIKPKHNSVKLCAILNARPANFIQPFLPTKFTLPNISSLKSLLKTKRHLFFHHTDVSNFYWSFILPPSLQQKFIFSIRDPAGVPHSFTLTRPPFGWDFIPAISNSIMQHILTSTSTPHLTNLLYVDDLLSISP